MATGGVSWRKPTLIGRTAQNFPLSARALIPSRTPFLDRVQFYMGRLGKFVATKHEDIEVDGEKLATTLVRGRVVASGAVLLRRSATP